MTFARARTQGVEPAMKNSANQPSTRYAADPAQQGALEVGDNGHALRETVHSAAVTPFPARPAPTISAHEALPEHAAHDQGGASFTPMRPRTLLIAAIVIAVLGGGA